MNKQNMLYERFRNAEPSSTLRINEISNKLIDEGKNVYKFGLGQSPFPVPEILIETLKKNAHQKDYLNVSGLLKLREVVAKYHSKKNLYNYSQDNVIIGPGSKELIFQCQMVTEMPLLLPKPSWVSYEPQARILKKEINWIDTSKNTNWHLSANALRDYCKNNKYKYQLLILNSPNNPTGTNNEELEELSIICKENNIIVISDEIYTELDFNGNYHSISHFYPEGTIISSGLSKWCGAGGWRLGTLTFPKELKIIYDSVRSLASETFTSVSAPIQYAAVKAYTEDHSEYLNNSRKILKKVADFVYDQLSEIGIECIRPQGGFYILCDFSKIIKHNNIINNAATLCEQVLQNTGFAMLPGKNFGIEDEKLITRMAFVDFDGNKALSFMKDNTSIKDDDFNELFPKINEGILNLKSWLKSEFLS
ncbi:MAG: aminotransferase class I/II-fold pyridoxal phosphate-dependent enzyme [Alphaproteobacteria bacterium]|nr:MAG: aminotransferase class I/II-fold pyridoxal phosphate-dependent enzyme [Alphaproteobacteria bacterium]